MAVMNDFEIQAKREQGKVYATQPERFELLELSLRMKSSHDVRFIRYAEGTWNCTCAVFQDHHVCSHVMATQEILGVLNP